MVRHPWIGNVRYDTFTPATIDYDIGLDAFYIARAQVRSVGHAYLLTIKIAVTERYLTANRLSLQEAIRMAQVRLDQLIAQHRGLLEALRTHDTRVFDLAGLRLR